MSLPVPPMQYVAAIRIQIQLSQPSIYKIFAHRTYTVYAMYVCMYEYMYVLYVCMYLCVYPNSAFPAIHIQDFRA